MSQHMCMHCMPPAPCAKVLSFSLLLAKSGLSFAEIQLDRKEIGLCLRLKRPMMRESMGFHS